MNAPVIVFAYNRAEKLEKCIGSLQKCKGSELTEVFIYADGSKGENDAEAVNLVRKYLDELEKDHGFKQLKVIRRPANIGLADNVIAGVTEIIERNGRVIVLEDDLMVGAGFLLYMNQALDFYEKDDHIWSITGFTEPVSRFKGYDHDIYYSYRGCSYGWGTWKDRWDTVDWDMKRYDEVMSDKMLRRKFERGGRDMIRILKDQKAGLVNSWAIRWCLEQSLQNKYTVYPVKSLVNNTGNDGSGTNAMRYPRTQVWAEESVNATLPKLEHLKPDRRICIDFYRYHSDILKRIMRNLNIKGIKKQMGRFVSLLYQERNRLP